MDINTEAPSTSPAAELSLDQIINGAVSEAAAKGEAIVQPDKAVEPANTEATPGVEAKPAEPAVEATPTEEAEPKTDEISAARARKILETVENRLKLVEDRERALTAREQDATKALLEELLKAPKGFLAKHGRHIDDLIDASVAEGTVAAPAQSDEDPRLTALEKRIEAREQAEKDARDQQIIANKKAEIHGQVTANAAKYPALTAANRVTDVTDYMVEYHATHGVPISWDKAAAAIEKDLTGIGIAVAKKMGWNPPAAASPKPATAERTASPTLSGAVSDSAQTEADLPEDPSRLLDFLVRKAQAAG